MVVFAQKGKMAWLVVVVAEKEAEGMSKTVAVVVIADEVEVEMGKMGMVVVVLEMCWLGRIKLLLDPVSRNCGLLW